MSKMLRGSSLLHGDNPVPGIKLTKELQKYIPLIIKACKKRGLDFFPPIIEKVTYDEMSELACYGGFPVRYPHWSFGMEYEQMARQYEHGMFKISEMVINNDPAYIYCMNTNTLLDDVLVIAHAIAHSDFFKNNVFFEATDRKMLTKMANHASRIRNYISRWGADRVFRFIDNCKKIETLVDFTNAWKERVYQSPIIKDERTFYHKNKIPVKHEYMDSWINTKEYMDKQQEMINKQEAIDQLELFVKPEKDIMGFLKDNANLKPWEQDIISMLYDEALYFAPQRMTKVMNEGWACLASESLICTQNGIFNLEDIVSNELNSNIWDGENNQKITDWYFHESKNRVKITTKHGYELCGSDNHRIWDRNKDWKQLGALNIGDAIHIDKGSNLWAKDFVDITWKPTERINIKRICDDCGISEWTYYDYKKNSRVRRKEKNIIKAIELVELEKNNGKSTECVQLLRKQIRIPKKVTTKLASFLGYMIGDGHISDSNRELGLTTFDDSSKNTYIKLSKELFGLDVNYRWDDSSLNGRWRCILYSKNLQDFLISLGFPVGVSARVKSIPECILKSPKKVMSAFLRSYFDSDGHAGKSGVILSTSSDKLAMQVQIILLNYGILSHKKKGLDDCWQIRINKNSALIFMKEIGFGLKRKQRNLKKYIDNCKNFEEENFDVIKHIEYGKGPVCDMTVQNTHRYSAHGFINHNSYWDSEILTTDQLVSLGQKTHDAGIVEYAIHKMHVLGHKYSMNPYALGYALFNDIKSRWDKGKFGDEYEKCKNYKERKEWNKNLNLGNEKIFEVRKFYCDMTFIAEFFTDDFCRKNEFFLYKTLPDGRTIIEEDDPKIIRSKFVDRFANGGLPDIRLVDPNYKNRDWFLMDHKHADQELDIQDTVSVMQSICAIWKKPVLLTTLDGNQEEMVIFVPDEENYELLIRQEFERRYT